MDNSVMFSLTYGLFVVTAREGDKDNGCITNTAAQVTDTPLRISLTVNKSNYTHLDNGNHMYTMYIFNKKQK